MVYLKAFLRKEWTSPRASLALLPPASRRSNTCASSRAALGPARESPAIVHALEGAIRFAHLQDLVRRRRPNSRHRLQFFRCRRIKIYRLGGRLFPSRVQGRGKDQTDKRNEERSWIGN